MLDFLQHQHQPPASIIGSSQAGVGDPRPLRTRKTVQDLIGYPSTTELPAWIYWQTCKPCFTMFGIENTALRKRAFTSAFNFWLLFRLPIIFSLRSLVLATGKEPFTSTTGCRLLLFKFLLIFGFKIFILYLLRFQIIFSLRSLVLAAGKEPFTSTIGCKLFMFKTLIVFDLHSFY